MRTILLRRMFCALAVLLSAGTALAVDPGQDTATLTTLHSFNGNDGYESRKLLQASDGNLYGTTGAGGNGYAAGSTVTGYGTIYRVSPAGVFTTLYSFTGGDDGAFPGSLLQAADGNIYGTTGRGGTGGRGTFFRLTTAGVLTTLFALTDVVNPVGPLLQGSDGSFYGTAGGDQNDHGAVYRFTLAGEFSILHRFTGFDGQTPTALIFGSDGNLYGTTELPNLVRPGDTAYYGTLFRLTLAGELTTIYGFKNDGYGFYPGSLVQGGDGNFYCACSNGGPTPDQDGTICRITPAGVPGIIHAFAAGSEGKSPQSLILGSDGNLYGTTTNSVLSTETPALATVFRLGLSGTFTTLYGTTNAARVRFDWLIQGRDGNLYGSSTLGNEYGYGLVFKLTIASHPAFFAGQVPTGGDVLYLGFVGGGYFGYYTFLSDPNFLYHFDLGFEYVVDANDGHGGVYLYDFASNGFFYTSRAFPFPYLYDFNSRSMVYYYPNPKLSGRYNTDGVRYFYQFNADAIITK